MNKTTKVVLKPIAALCAAAMLSMAGGAAFASSINQTPAPDSIRMSATAIKKIGKFISIERKDEAATDSFTPSTSRLRRAGAIVSVSNQSSFTSRLRRAGAIVSVSSQPQRVNLKSVGNNMPPASQEDTKLCVGFGRSDDRPQQKTAPSLDHK